jgi:hypothetical protein
MALILVIPYMAYISRLCGGGWPRLPSKFDQLLFALPYIVVLWPLMGFWAILGFMGAFAGKCGPTAPWLDLGTSTRWRKTSLTFLIDWLRGKVSEYAYDVCGLAISGLTVTIAPAILCAIWGHHWAAAALLASGAAKALAYMIGWKIFPDDRATVTGEYLTGAFAGVGILVSYALCG